MSQQSDMADAVHKRLYDGPVATADLVRDRRRRWGPEHGVTSVHGFVREVANCLLHHNDVEIGDVDSGTFVAWNLEPWDADERVDSALMAMDDFLEDDTRYVFRTKPA